MSYRTMPSFRAASTMRCEGFFFPLSTIDTNCGLTPASRASCAIVTREAKYARISSASVTVKA